MRQMAVVGLLALICALAAPASNSLAQEKSTEEITRALEPKKKIRTRGLSVSPQPTVPENLRSMRGSTHGLGLVEREELASAVKGGSIPQIDIEILFEYNSAKLNAQSRSQLTKLGLALSNVQFSGSRFVVAGHTDATGGEDYNQKLSEERAKTVRTFLLTTFRLDPEALIVVGYGEEQLKNPSQPEAAENRRVQILNLGG